MPVVMLTCAQRTSSRVCRAARINSCTIWLVFTFQLLYALSHLCFLRENLLLGVLSPGRIVGPMVAHWKPREFMLVEMRGYAMLLVCLFAICLANHG